MGFIRLMTAVTSRLQAVLAVEKKKFDLQVALAEEFCVNRVIFCIIF